MSLPDPMPLKFGSSDLTFVGGADSNLFKQIAGQYTTGGSAPIKLAVRSTVITDGRSQYNVRLTHAKDLPPISGIPQKDDILDMSFLMKVPSSFTPAEVKWTYSGLFQFLWLQNDRLLRGEL